MTTLCECPTYPGRVVSDSERHREWHELVEEQTGLTGLCDAAALHKARGHGNTLAMETVLDRRARESGKRASGAMRRASHAQKGD